MTDQLPAKVSSSPVPLSFKRPPLDAIPPEVVALSDFEALARERLSDLAWEYIASGSADEVTVRRNRDAFDRLLLHARMLADVSGGNTQLELFGQRFEHPILLAPVAYQGIAHTEAELAVARGAAATQTGMILSTLSSYTLEEVAAVAARPRWFQLYAQADRGFTRQLVERAEAAGYQALVITIDTPTTGARNREQRVQFHLPAGVEVANLRGLAKRSSPRAPWPPEKTLFGNLPSALTWKDVVWLRSLTKLPVLLKGVMSPLDAVRGIDEGFDGLVVSNHGGRNLDTLPATIEMLPRIAQAAGGRVPVLLDSGVRRGTDVLKALALGARAVLIGRPYVYGLAAAGEAGVAQVVRVLRAELEAAMVLTGRATLAEIDESVLWRES